MEVTEDPHCLSQIGDGGALRAGGEEYHLLANVVAALEAVDEAANDRLEQGTVDWTGVSRG